MLTSPSVAIETVMPMEYSDYLVFVDESGDHSLVSIDPKYPAFVLALCIIKKTDYAGFLVPKLKDVKIKYFNHDLAILHERDISRRKEWFSTFNEQKRKDLMHDLGSVIEQTPFWVIAGIIDKPKLRKQYKNPEHPYHLALKFALERLAIFLRAQGQHTLQTTVICEARGKNEDRALELAFLQICGGNNFSKEHYPHDIIIADKKCNSEGLQLADLIARPIGLSHLRPEQPNRAYEILKSKFCATSEGEIDGVGRKVFP